MNIFSLFLNSVTWCAKFLSVLVSKFTKAITLPACCVVLIVGCASTELDYQSYAGKDGGTINTNGSQTLRRGLSGRCYKCTEDIQCIEGYRCVQMTFKGTTLSGGRCLEKKVDSCGPSYSIHVSRKSISGALLDGEYCGIREDLTTCDAVEDVGDQCTTNEECGIQGLEDGYCRPIAPQEPHKVCTTLCKTDDDCAGIFYCLEGFCTASMIKSR